MAGTRWHYTCDLDVVYAEKGGREPRSLSVGSSSTYLPTTVRAKLANPGQPTYAINYVRRRYGVLSPARPKTSNDLPRRRLDRRGSPDEQGA